jgi:hypothetical protein
MEKSISFESREEEIVLSFESSVKAVSELFRNYSVEDVAESIFISSVWLPNISSPIKHQLITAVFASLKPEEYSRTNQIKSYDDFKEFLGKLYKSIPQFPGMEDYVPEPDWGQVKFHHAGRNYKMFYGCELSYVYEYLTLLQIIHLPVENEYVKLVNRSPGEELECCLRLQEEVINGIGAQPDSKSISDISPGHIEIPPDCFWQDAKSFYSHFKPEERYPEHFLKEYSLQLGTVPKRVLRSERFGERVYEGKLLPAFFIEHKSRYFSILPRRYPSILFDAWSEVFEKNRDKIEASGKRLHMSLNAQVYRFIKKRLKTELIYPLVSPVKKDGKPHELIFTTALVSKDKLILIYLTQPTLSGKKTQEELETITPMLNEAVALTSTQPTTLALHLERQNVQLQPAAEGRSLKTEVIVVIPQVSTQVEPFSIPKSLPGRVTWLDSLVGIADELEDDEDIANFLEYPEEIEDRVHPPGLSMLDKFASFKDSEGVLIGGALEYDFISLDPHWGSQRRYKTLSEFWSVYPEVDFFDHPRTWTVKQETKTRVRFAARGHFGFALHCKIGATNIYMTAPFAEMSFEQGNLSNLLMECLEDSFSLRKSVFQDHDLLKNIDRLQINLFPLSLVSVNAKFKHLKHLCKTGKYWCSDYGLPTPDFYGIRIVFDDAKIAEAFKETQDSSIEVEILLEVLRQMDSIMPDTRIDRIIEGLEKTKAARPRFKLVAAEKPASFPEFVNPYEPKQAHFKRARKRIAEIARKLGISEGYYQLEEAKGKLNLLKSSIVYEINSLIAKYDFTSGIPFLITRIDGLSAHYERNRMRVEHGLQHDIDYEPEEKYAEEHNEYVKMHANYRYLIEKFVHIEPHGQRELEEDEFQYLTALVDWLLVFYSASDNIHYGILPVGMELDRDFSVDVKYEEGMKAKTKEFSEQMANLDLGLIGKTEDRVSSPRAVEEFMEKLDEAFLKDLGFSFKFLINVLQLLTFWPTTKPDIEENPFYSAELAEIEDVCVETIQGIRREEIRPIMEFLTLNKDDVIRVLGQSEPCPDLPVWEYRKRYSRYTLRPIIKIGDKYHWGPYSARSAGLIWSGTPLTGTLPTDLDASATVGVLRTEKGLIEKALTEKALEIMKRYTPHAKKNLKLHELKPKGSHPPELGDYDLLAFYPQKNVIFNIECKDILPVHCLKDAKRLREKIFGQPGKDKGHFAQIDKREKYLSAHIPDIAKALDWPLDPNHPPEIITIYQSRRSYWWTHFPPYDVTAKFLRIDLLSDFIEHIH